MTEELSTDEIIETCVALIDRADSEEAALRADKEAGRIAASIEAVEKAIPDLLGRDALVLMGATAALWGLRRGEDAGVLLPEAVLVQLVRPPVSTCLDALLHALRKGKAGAHAAQLSEAVELLTRVVGVSLARKAVRDQIAKSRAVRAGVEKGRAARRRH